MRKSGGGREREREGVEGDYAKLQLHYRVARVSRYNALCLFHE